ncbi:MAG TPA: hypothetical protein VHX66_03990 [Solirubrobacteraceae bacterium]|jgi:hypothetical protein|nr:hypothetical protein [Solirubrobacteraceae bacterium]
MNDSAVAGWRQAVRRGELPSDLVSLLRNVALRMCRRRVLPPSFAPYGQWDDEAGEEIFAAWYADRLVSPGQLLALLDRSSSEAALRALAERSLRQHLLNRADRSQTRNLFGRVVAVLRERPAFVLVHAASRPANTWYGLRPPAGRDDADVPLWSGPERLLVAHGWALGDLAIIRYRASAAKLSPVLDSGELERFITGLMSRTNTALTAAQIMTVLAARLDLGAPQTHDLEAEPIPASASRAPEDAVALADTARAIVDGLTSRQREVLRRADDTVASIAKALRCSVGTIVNERRRIAVAVSRLSEDEDERGVLLNMAADLLYPLDDE